MRFPAEIFHLDSDVRGRVCESAVANRARVGDETDVDTVVFVGARSEQTDLSAAAFFRRSAEEDDATWERVEGEEVGGGKGAGEGGSGD